MTADTHEAREDPPHAQDLLLYNKALSFLFLILIGYVKRQVITIIIKPRTNLRAWVARPT
jgi:hypothetical protein